MIKTKRYTVKEKLEAAKQPRTRPVKNRGKYYNSGFTKSMMLHESTHSKLSALTPKSATYEKLILKMITVLSEEGLLKKVTDYPYYNKLKVE